MLMMIMGRDGECYYQANRIVVLIAGRTDFICVLILSSLVSLFAASIVSNHHPLLLRRELTDNNQRCLAAFRVCSNASNAAETSPSMVVVVILFLLNWICEISCSIRQQQHDNSVSPRRRRPSLLFSTTTADDNDEKVTTPRVSRGLSGAWNQPHHHHHHHRRCRHPYRILPQETIKLEMAAARVAMCVSKVGLFCGILREQCRKWMCSAIKASHWALLHHDDCPALISAASTPLISLPTCPLLSLRAQHHTIISTKSSFE